jgi:hypothetical protein
LNRLQAPIIDWAQPVFPAVCLTIMFFTAYGGDWITALAWLGCAWLDVYMTGKTEKALPMRTYLCRLDYSEY